MSRRIVVVTAGLTVPSSTRLLADQLAEATTAQVTARGEAADIEFVEVREVAGELATFMVTGGIPTPRLTELRELVASADGLIVVTPVFNGSYSGLFKMFFDALDKEEARRHRQHGGDRLAGVAECPPPQWPDDRHEQPVEQHRREIRDRDDEQDQEPFDDPDATDAGRGEGAGKEPIERPRRHLLEERRDRVERA